MLLYQLNISKPTESEIESLWSLQSTFEWNDDSQQPTAPVLLRYVRDTPDSNTSLLQLININTVFKQHCLNRKS